MKKFMIKSTVAGIFILGVHIFAVVTADGTVDPFYMRLTTGAQRSLVVGTSRASQGFQPEVMNSVLEPSGMELPLFNFSFTLMHSSYGPVYYKAIKEKLDPATRNGLFIVAVDPWSICTPGDNPDDVDSFREKGQFLDNVSSVNGSHPNFDYFMSFNEGFGSIFVRRMENWTSNVGRLLHKDGWFEITPPMDEESLAKRYRSKVKQYTANIEKYRFSKVRLEYLKKTIRLFKEHGTVYMVRLPVSQQFLDIEARLLPDFDDKMELVSNECQVEYLNYSHRPDEFVYTDGSHIYKESGKKLSKEIAGTILNAQLVAIEK